MVTILRSSNPDVSVSTIYILEPLLLRLPALLFVINSLITESESLESLPIHHSVHSWDDAIQPALPKPIASTYSEFCLWELTCITYYDVQFNFSAFKFVLIGLALNWDFQMPISLSQRSSLWFQLWEYHRESQSCAIYFNFQWSLKMSRCIICRIFLILGKYTFLTYTIFREKYRPNVFT